MLRERGIGAAVAHDVSVQASADATDPEPASKRLWQSALFCCFYLSLGVLVTRVLLFGVYNIAPNFWKRPSKNPPIEVGS